MVSGKFKSGTFRKLFKRVPSGKAKVVYEKRKPKQAKCGSCGKALHGIPRMQPKQNQNIPKTKKRPERPFGGVLCSSCSRKRIKDTLLKGEQ